ncbi:retrovirus-related pol polyprotein from transposon TNT 1-94 [Tanacetum coccineum]
MTPELHRQFENSSPYDMMKELKSMFEKQVGVERFDLIQTFHACKQEEGKPVGPYVLKMKGYVEQLKCFGYMLPQDISVGLILNGLTSDFTGFVRNYNMHNMGKTVDELHALLIEYEKGLPKKAATPQVMAIQGGRIQKANEKSQNAKGKGKGKGKGKDKSQAQLRFYYLCHRRLAHISKKRIEKLQDDGLLKSTDEESFDKCVYCLSGKMTRKPFPHRTERATDLLGYILMRVVYLDMCQDKWHPKVTAIEESKDLSTLPLDELIGNLKVYKVVLEKDSEISKVKKEKYKSLALKARKISSDEEVSCSESDDEEYAMAIKEDKKEKEDRRCFKCGDPNHFISDCPKHSYNDQKAFVVGCWSDSEEDSKKKEIYLMALDNNEVLSDTPYYSNSSLDSESLQNEYNNSLSLKLASIESSRIFLQEMLEKQKTQKDKNGIGFKEDIASNSNTKTKKSGLVDKEMSTIELTLPVLSSSIEQNWLSAENAKTLGSNLVRVKVKIGPDEWIKDSGCSRHMTGNKDLFSSYKAIDEDDTLTLWHQRLGHANMRLIQSLSAKELNPKMSKKPYKTKVGLWLCKKNETNSKQNDVWSLVPPPDKKTIIGTKWVFKNKLDENSVVSRNKARLVAQRYNQQEGIDFDETYAPIARLESIRILLAYACAHDFKLFQMDIKSAFLNSFINEEVYVPQPPGFVNFEKPNHVFKLKRALYGLKQAPKAWYDRLKTFLLNHMYTMGLFEISMMGELNFFLGLQIKQLEDGIFFNQSKYIKKMLKKFGLEDSKPIKTPMSSETKLTRDKDGESVNDTKYRGMIEFPKTSHLEAVKRIFRYIKGTTHLGLWYPKGTGVETIVYADSNHAGDYVERKSTSGLRKKKAHRHGKVYNWETATYGNIWYNEEVHDLRSFKTEFPVIVFNDTLTPEVTLSCKPTVSPLNDNEIDFRISFDESDDEDYNVVYDENLLSYKIIYVNNLKTDSENDNKVNMPSFPSSEPEDKAPRLHCFYPRLGSLPELNHFLGSILSEKTGKIKQFADNLCVFSNDLVFRMILVNSGCGNRTDIHGCFQVVEVCCLHVAAEVDLNNFNSILRCGSEAEVSFYSIIIFTCEKLNSQHHFTCENLLATTTSLTCEKAEVKASETHYSFTCERANAFLKGENRSNRRSSNALIPLDGPGERILKS